MKRALLSVSDKRGIVDFARALAARGAEILSTGGTYRALADARVPVREVSEVTRFPEMLDGRVKTLHPAIHGGILARRDLPEHLAAIAEHGIAPIDLVCVNLYPFEETVAKPGVAFEEAIENIDIGGPSLVRAAAKNADSVAIVTDPDDYASIVKELEAFGELSASTREKLRRKAFVLTARYDAAIARWLESREADSGFPTVMTLTGGKVADLRYGENPHQAAAFYRIPGATEASVATARLRRRKGEPGKALSYNNLLDLDAALALVREFEGPAVAIVKHNNPCGVATRAVLREAADAAWQGDPVSAFGSVIAVNRSVDRGTADFLADEGHFVECIVAPAFEDDAFALLTTRPKWGKNVRLLETGPLTPPDPRDRVVRKVAGGFVVQDRDLAPGAGLERRVVTKRTPTDEEARQMIFAAAICKHVKSNAIVLAREHALAGAGGGQTSRVDAARLAVEKAGRRAKGSVAASDAFFPFPDGVEVLAAAGVTAIVQPGGSVRDAEVIAACNAHGIAMWATGVRHFLH